MTRPSRGARFNRAPRVETLIVGAGQAGLALSYHLSGAGHDHVLLERGGVGQRWQERWDSLTLLSPNWMNRLPGAPAHAHEHGFLTRTDYIDYLEAYARSFAAPLDEGVEVELVERSDGGFRVHTSSGIRWARNVVLATGDATLPHVPFTAPPGVVSLHSSEYRRPTDVPDGRVLVVGAGASGQQIALELAGAGRDVMIAAGRHSRAPRRFRGRDIFAWLDLLGDFDRTIDELPDLAAAKRVPLFPLSGANGGQDLGLDSLVRNGATVTGRLNGFDGTRAVFADDLTGNLAAADARLRKLLRRIDRHAFAHESEPVVNLRLPRERRTLDLRTVAAVVWATGYRRAYPWLAVPGVIDDDGEVRQRRGVTRVPGVFVLGLAYQYRRSSHFIGGVGRDAELLARQLTASASHAHLGRAEVAFS
jgi:putative flavoprotein involved in K+ transport